MVSAPRPEYAAVATIIAMPRTLAASRAGERFSAEDVLSMRGATKLMRERLFSKKGSDSIGPRLHFFEGLSQLSSFLRIIKAAGNR